MSLHRFAAFTLVLVSFSAAALAQAKPPAVPPAKDSAPKDGDKEVAGMITDMQKLVAAKKDDQAIEKPMNDLVNRFEKCGPKDRLAIANAVAKNLDVVRIADGGVKEGSKEEPEQPRLFQSSIVALSQFHELGCDRLVATYDRTEFKHSKRFRGRILQMIGKTEQVSAVEFLLTKVFDKDDSIDADAITALGNYTKAPEEKRKEIINKLIKQFNSAKGNAADPSTPAGKTAKDRYDIIAPAMIDTLQKLTNQNALRDPREWESWWNKNNKKPLG